MAHYAFLDENNIVTEVIVGRNEDEVVDGISDWETYYGEFRGQVCKRTSYNTVKNTHRLGGIPYRKNYAGIGSFYDAEKDAFYQPNCPFAGWVFNEETCDWEAPFPAPDKIKPYYWDIETLNWIEVPQSLIDG
jgi:hypothetical protein